MRLLADENFPKPLVEELRSLGHDVVWARTDYPGWKDPALLELAEVERRVVLTLDKDFWQIALQRRPALRSAGLVWLRVHPATVEHLAPLVRLMLHMQVGWHGQASILTPEGLQMMRLARH